MTFIFSAHSSESKSRLGNLNSELLSSDMPELPEVETIARGLNKRVAGDVIGSVWLGSKPEPLKSSAAEIAAALQAKRITGVRRSGKHIVFDLLPTSNGAKPAQWIVHLGMTGSMQVC